MRFFPLLVLGAISIVVILVFLAQVAVAAPYVCSGTNSSSNLAFTNVDSVSIENCFYAGSLTLTGALSTISVKNSGFANTLTFSSGTPAVGLTSKVLFQDTAIWYITLTVAVAGDPAVPLPRCEVTTSSGVTTSESAAVDFLRVRVSVGFLFSKCSFTSTSLRIADSTFKQTNFAAAGYRLVTVDTTSLTSSAFCIRNNLFDHWDGSQSLLLIYGFSPGNYFGGSFGFISNTITKGSSMTNRWWYNAIYVAPFQNVSLTFRNNVGPLSPQLSLTMGSSITLSNNSNLGDTDFSCTDYSCTLTSVESMPAANSLSITGCAISLWTSSVKLRVQGVVLKNCDLPPQGVWDLRNIDSLTLGSNWVFTNIKMSEGNLTLTNISMVSLTITNLKASPSSAAGSSQQSLGLSYPMILLDSLRLSGSMAFSQCTFSVPTAQLTTSCDRPTLADFHFAVIRTTFAYTLQMTQHGFNNVGILIADNVFGNNYQIDKSIDIGLPTLISQTSMCLFRNRITAPSISKGFVIGSATAAYVGGNLTVMDNVWNNKDWSFAWLYPYQAPPTFNWVIAVVVLQRTAVLIRNNSFTGIVALGFGDSNPTIDRNIINGALTLTCPNTNCSLNFTDPPNGDMTVTSFSSLASPSTIQLFGGPGSAAKLGTITITSCRLSAFRIRSLSNGAINIGTSRLLFQGEESPLDIFSIQNSTIASGIALTSTTIDLTHRVNQPIADVNSTNPTAGSPPPPVAANPQTRSSVPYILLHNITVVAGGITCTSCTILGNVTSQDGHCAAATGTDKAATLAPSAAPKFVFSEVVSSNPIQFVPANVYAPTGYLQNIVQVFRACRVVARYNDPGAYQVISTPHINVSFCMFDSVMSQQDFSLKWQFLPSNVWNGGRFVLLRNIFVGTWSVYPYIAYFASLTYDYPFYNSDLLLENNTFGGHVRIITLGRTRIVIRSNALQQTLYLKGSTTAAPCDVELLGFPRAWLTVDSFVWGSFAAYSGDSVTTKVELLNMRVTRLSLADFAASAATLTLTSLNFTRLTSDVDSNSPRRVSYDPLEPLPLISNVAFSGAAISTSSWVTSSGNALQPQACFVNTTLAYFTIANCDFSGSQPNSSRILRFQNMSVSLWTEITDTSFQRLIFQIWNSKFLASYNKVAALYWRLDQTTDFHLCIANSSFVHQDKGLYFASAPSYGSRNWVRGSLSIQNSVFSGTYAWWPNTPYYAGTWTDFDVSLINTTIWMSNNSFRGHFRLITAPTAECILTQNIFTTSLITKCALKAGLPSPSCALLLDTLPAGIAGAGFQIIGYGNVSVAPILSVVPSRSSRILAGPVNVEDCVVYRFHLVGVSVDTGGTNFQFVDSTLVDLGTDPTPVLLIANSTITGLLWFSSITLRQRYLGLDSRGAIVLSNSTFSAFTAQNCIFSASSPTWSGLLRIGPSLLHIETSTFATQTTLEKIFFSNATVSIVDSKLIGFYNQQAALALIQHSGTLIDTSFVILDSTLTQNNAGFLFQSQYINWLRGSLIFQRSSFIGPNALATQFTWWANGYVTRDLSLVNFTVRITDCSFQGITRVPLAGASTAVFTNNSVTSTVAIFGSTVSNLVNRVTLDFVGTSFGGFWFSGLLIRGKIRPTHPTDYAYALQPVPLVLIDLDIQLLTIESIALKAGATAISTLRVGSVGAVVGSGVLLFRNVSLGDWLAIDSSRFGSRTTSGGFVVTNCTMYGVQFTKTIFQGIEKGRSCSESFVPFDDVTYVLINQTTLNYGGLQFTTSPNLSNVTIRVLNSSLTQQWNTEKNSILFDFTGGLAPSPFQVSLCVLRSTMLSESAFVSRATATIGWVSSQIVLLDNTYQGDGWNPSYIFYYGGYVTYNVPVVNSSVFLRSLPGSSSAVGTMKFFLSGKLSSCCATAGVAFSGTGSQLCTASQPCAAPMDTATPNLSDWSTVLGSRFPDPTPVTIFVRNVSTPIISLSEIAQRLLQQTLGQTFAASQCNPRDIFAVVHSATDTATSSRSLSLSRETLSRSKSATATTTQTSTLQPTASQTPSDTHGRHQDRPGDRPQLTETSSMDTSFSHTLALPGIGPTAAPLTFRPVPRFTKTIVTPAPAPSMIPRAIQQAASTTTSVAGAVAGLTSPGTAAQASRTNFLMEASNCAVVDFNETLQFGDNPFRMSIGNGLMRDYLGASFGQAIVVFGVMLVHFAGGLLFGKCHGYARISDGLAWIRQPSFFVFVIMFVMQSSISAAVTCLNHGVEMIDRILPALAILFWLLWCLYCAHLLISTRFNNARWEYIQARTVDRKTGKVISDTIFRKIVRWSAGGGEWKDSTEPTEKGFCRRFAFIFKDYRTGRQWFFLLELLVTVLLAVADGLKPTGLLACQARLICVMIVFVVYFLLTVILRPQVAPLNLVFFIVMSGLQASASICAVAVKFAGFPYGDQIAGYAIAVLGPMLAFKGILDIILLLNDIREEAIEARIRRLERAAERRRAETSGGTQGRSSSSKSVLESSLEWGKGERDSVSSPLLTLENLDPTLGSPLDFSSSGKSNSFSRGNPLLSGKSNNSSPPWSSRNRGRHATKEPEDGEELLEIEISDGRNGNPLSVL